MRAAAALAPALAYDHAGAPRPWPPGAAATTNTPLSPCGCGPRTSSPAY